MLFYDFNLFVRLAYAFSDRLRDCKVDIDNTSSPIKRRQLSRTLSSPKDIRFVFNKQSRVLTLHKLKCITTLGELRLQTDINNVNFCACHKIEEHQGTLLKRSSAGKERVLQYLLSYIVLSHWICCRFFGYNRRRC